MAALEGAYEERVLVIFHENVKKQLNHWLSCLYEYSRL